MGRARFETLWRGFFVPSSSDQTTIDSYRSTVGFREQYQTGISEQLEQRGVSCAEQLSQCLYASRAMQAALNAHFLIRAVESCLFQVKIYDFLWNLERKGQCKIRAHVPGKGCILRMFERKYES